VTLCESGVRPSERRCGMRKHSEKVYSEWSRSHDHDDNVGVCCVPIPPSDLSMEPFLRPRHRHLALITYKKIKRLQLQNRGKTAIKVPASCLDEY